MMTKSIEEILNDFYRQAGDLVSALSLLGTPKGMPSMPIDEGYKSQLDEFASVIRESFDTIKREGYAPAWGMLQKATERFIGLCEYKENRAPRFEPNLSGKCAEAYRALPEPKDTLPVVDASLLSEENIETCERYYRKITGDPRVPGQPANIASLTEDQFGLLRRGTEIWIRDKFGGDQKWYAARVTQSNPDSIAPTVDFKIADPSFKKRYPRSDGNSMYYFSDARHIALRNASTAE